jgi:HEAT repeat protein
MAAQDTLLFQRKLQAVNRLGELKNERGVMTLIALIEDNIAGVQRLDATKKDILRSAAIDSLGQIGGTAALAKLNDLLNSQDPKEKAMAIHALSGASGSQVVANLLAALKAEKSIDVKASIITALGKVGAALGTQEKEAIAKELVARMKGTDMGEVHGASIRALGLLKLKSSTTPLLEQYRLWLSDPKKTQDIVEALGEIGDDAAVDSLVPVLTTGSKFVKIAIATALGKIGGTKAIAALKKRVTVETDEDVKKAISKAIP